MMRVARSTEDHADGDDGNAESLHDAVEKHLAVQPGHREQQRPAGPRGTPPAQFVAFHEVADLTLEAHAPLFQEHRPVGDGGPTFSDCSTIISVYPAAFRPSITSISSCTMIGARPRESSSIIRTAGSCSMATAKCQHLLLPTREGVGPLSTALLQGGKEIVDPVGPPAQLGLVGAVDEATHFEVLRHRHRAEDALPTLQEMVPSRERCSGVV